MIDMIEWMTHMMMMMIDPLIFDTHTRIVWVFKEFTNNNNRNSIQFNSKWNIILAPSFIAKKTCIIHTQWMNEWMKCWHTHTDPQYGQNMIHWSFDHWPKIIKFLSYPFFFYCVREIKKKLPCARIQTNKKKQYSRFGLITDNRIEDWWIEKNSI